MVPIAVDRLQDYIDMGRLIPPTDRPINMQDMVKAGLTKASNIKFGCKLLLGKCEISDSGPPVRFHPDRDIARLPHGDRGHRGGRGVRHDRAL